MNKKKLWSFGCSHSAGMCLTKKVSKQDLDDFYKARGCKDWNDFYNRYSINKLENLHRLWQKRNKNPVNPHLSFAGRLAEKLDLEFKTYAFPGAGIDRILYWFLKKESEIDFNNDIVLFEIPPVYRYMLETPDEVKDYQYALSLTQKSIKSVPSLETLEIFYSVSLEFIKLKYPSVHFIKIREQDISLDNITTLCDLSLENLNNLLNNPKYPSGHYWINTHEKYAEMLKECL